MKCKYCSDNLVENASYCGNCGSTVSKEGKNIFIDIFSKIFKGVINPNAFIRNSKIFELGKTGIILGLIILLTVGECLIFAGSPLGKLLGYFFVEEKTITTELIKVIISILISSIVILAATSIKKVKTSFIQILNFEIHGYLFIAIFSILAAIFNAISLNLIGVIVLIYGTLLYTIIMIQGMKSIWNFNTIISFLIYILRAIATSVVTMVIMRIL